MSSAMSTAFAHWSAEAMAGRMAGTRDLIARELEQRVLAEHLTDGMRVLDAGCGDGGTARYLASIYPNIRIHGIDFVPSLIEAAVAASVDYTVPGLPGHQPRLTFAVGDLLDPPPGPWDAVITQRAIINLPDWETQARAIEGLIRTLKPGGRYLMLENSADGLARLNWLRQEAGLSRIDPPSHNRYLLHEAVRALYHRLANDGVVEQAYHVRYSDTYYFLSRVVNAALSDGEPDYDAPVNRLALSLPSINEPCGQGRLWVWEKL